jgi:hypothetical protein
MSQLRADAVKRKFEERLRKEWQSEELEWTDEDRRLVDAFLAVAE